MRGAEAGNFGIRSIMPELNKHSGLRDASLRASRARFSRLHASIRYIGAGSLAEYEFVVSRIGTGWHCLGLALSSVQRRQCRNLRPLAMEHLSARVNLTTDPTKPSCGQLEVRMYT
jgi:hypothetical protein